MILPMLDEITKFTFDELSASDALLLGQPCSVTARRVEGPTTLFPGIGLSSRQGI